MSGTITAIAAGAVLSAGASAYSAHEANKAAKESAESYNEMIQGYLNLDKQQTLWGMDMYQHGDIDWVDESGAATPVTPYQSTFDGGVGYYYDKRKKVFVNDALYDEYSRGGKVWKDPDRFEWHPAYNKAEGVPTFQLDGESVDSASLYKNPATGERGVFRNKQTGKPAELLGGGQPSASQIQYMSQYPDTWEWVPATEVAPEQQGFSQNDIEKMQLNATGEMFPKVQAYAGEALAAARGLMPYQTQAQQAQLQHTIDTQPWETKTTIADSKRNLQTAVSDINAKNAQNRFVTNTVQSGIEATNASNRYTAQAKQEKLGMIRNLSALAKRNTEGEAARMAGAEVSQAFATQQRTLADDIRRTGAVAGSGRMAGLQADLNTDRTKAIAGARTAARKDARESRYDQLARAVQLI